MFSLCPIPCANRHSKLFSQHRDGDLFYIAKTLLVGWLLWFWRNHYKDDIAPKLSPTGYLIAIAAGLVTLFIWVAPKIYSRSSAHLPASTPIPAAGRRKPFRY